MAEKQLTSALREFDEKYYGNSLPADTVQDFGLLLDRTIKDLISARDAGESEEHCKKIINTFLEQSFYGEKDFKVNTFNRIDSSISHHDELRALIEVKRVDSKTEMVSCDNLNKKALWELVLYYLAETRNTTGKHVTRKSNVEIRRLIATDGLKWVLIDANDFERLCDGELEKLFFKYRNRQLTYFEDNGKFYEDVSEYLGKIDVTRRLPFVYFDLREMQKSKRNLKYLYKCFSPEFLLKLGFKARTTQHTLNERFYQELLYIMGLKEITDKNRTVIQIDGTIRNSLADQVFRKYTVDKERPVEEAIEKAFELIIIWLDRLLFIKLFEGQLIAFNSDDACYHILDNDKIKSFQNLQDLFFEVLGRKDRPDEDFYRQFEQVPYLNSSLFERQRIESDDININELANLPIEKKHNSILGKSSPKMIVILEYIIDFLNSYCFAARSLDSETDEQNRDIIDAAVLGLIFEKLNGYRDGSHYTPSVITEYMCKTTIEEVVIRKVNSALSWDCHSLLEIREQAAVSTQIAQQVNQAINSIKICENYLTYLIQGNAA